MNIVDLSCLLISTLVCGNLSAVQLSNEAHNDIVMSRDYKVGQWTELWYIDYAIMAVIMLFWFNKKRAPF